MIISRDFGELECLNVAGLMQYCTIMKMAPIMRVQDVIYSAEWRSMIVKEYKEQIYLIEWAKLNNIILVSSLNGEKRTKQRGYILQKMGMQAGFPDLAFYKASTKYHSLFIEMKQNRKYSPSEMKTDHWLKQKWWIDYLNSQGFYAEFSFGWQHGAKIIEKYISG